MKDDNGSKSASEVDQSRDITLFIFWQVHVLVSQCHCLVKGRYNVNCALPLRPLFQVVPDDVLFSYGHCTLTVPLPHSMAAISKVS